MRSNENQWSINDIREGEQIFVGDILMTSDTGLATLQLSDGSKLQLSTGTTLQVSPREDDDLSLAESLLQDGRLWGRILSATGTTMGGSGLGVGVRG